MGKRYLINGGEGANGPLPHFVVELLDENAPEAAVPAREQAQERYMNGEEPAAVANFLQGRVVDDA